MASLHVTQTVILTFHRTSIEYVIIIRIIMFLLLLSAEASFARNEDRRNVCVSSLLKCE